jgi:rhodanese-related sulfurtransferase
LFGREREKRALFLIRAWPIALLIILLGALAPYALIVCASPYTSIDVNVAYNMITNGTYPNLMVLDVRTKSEYDSGHIYGATWIPVDELNGRIGEISGHKDQEIIVYCKAGGRSATASGILDSHNFTKVYNMLGGISAWQAAGYPTWNATVHNVNTTFNYDTIQAAIDSAKTLNGHTILVDKGVYYEHVSVSKTLSITGENSLDTVIDGNGTGTVILVLANNVTVENFTLRNGIGFGVYLNAGNYAQIRNNKIAHSYCGVNVSSSYNMIFGNEIANNEGSGVLVTQSDNTIFENNITANNCGLCLNGSQASGGNVIYHNNFSNNTCQASTSEAYGLWDGGYPSGGNYWTDYNGTDLFSGVHQSLTGSDGLGDTPYMIDASNMDYYPLICPWLWGPRLLTILSSEGGTTSPAPGTYSYNATSYIRVTANSYDDYTFEHWECEGYNFSGANPIDIRTDADHTLKAVFARIKYTLEVTSTAGGTTDPTAGNHTFVSGTAALVSALADPGYYLDRWELDNVYIGIFSPVSVIMNKNHTLHAAFRQLDVEDNLAVKWITSKTIVGQGFNLSVKVTIMNIGSHIETFNVTAYIDSASVMLQNVTLDGGAFATLALTLDTSRFSKGNYTLGAYAWPVPGETDTEDNNMTDGWVIVAMVGDITGPSGYPDGRIDVRDVAGIASRYGAKPPNPKYDVNWDITGPTPGLADGRIDVRDVALIASRYGQKDP